MHHEKRKVPGAAHHKARSRSTNARPNASSRSTSAPKSDWSIAQLAKIGGVSVRTLHYYLQLGLLRPAKFRGKATRYDRLELLRLLWIVRTKARRRLSLTEMARELRRLGDRDLEAWIVQQPLAPHVAAVLGVQPSRADGEGKNELGKGSGADKSSAATKELAHASNETARVTTSLHGASVERWERVRLLPGLELLVRADASPAVRSVAQRLHDEYAG